MRKFYLAFSIALIFLLFGCSASSNPFTPTVKPMPKVTALSARTPTIIPTSAGINPTLTYTSTLTQKTPTLTSLAEPLTRYSEIPPGLYIVYRGADGHIYITTKDKKFSALLTDKLDICFNTSDGGQIYVCDGDTKYRLDIKQDHLDILPNYGEPSPDGNWVTHNCKGYEDWESLAVQRVGQNDEFCLVKPSDKGFDLAFQGWSPEGKWLAYTKRISKTFMYDPPDKEDGLYLVNTGCLSKPEACPENTQGPFYINGVELRNMTPWYSRWSPDGQQLALYASDHSKLFFFNIKSKKFREFTMTGGKGWVDGFAISPDGSTIAYIRPVYPDNCCSFLEPLSGGPSFKLADSGEGFHPLFWLTVPSFHIEQRLRINDKGSHLNLRDQPSMNGNVITQLLEGDEIKIIDGPIGFGTYVWWKVHTGTKNHDGWVIEVKEWYDPVEP